MLMVNNDNLRIAHTRYTNIALSQQRIDSGMCNYYGVVAGIVYYCKNNLITMKDVKDKLCKLMMTH